MIPRAHIVQAVVDEVHTRAGQLMLWVTGSSLAVGLSIERVNQYLQAGAFIVSMIAGLCAAVYYIRKAFSK